ncbi:hypothetical protein ACFX1Z_001116 [Malus domestica]
MNMEKVLILREVSKIIMEINLVFREEMDMLAMEIGLTNKEEISMVTIGGLIMGILIQDNILVMEILATEMEIRMATIVDISQVMVNSLKMAIRILEIHTLGIMVLYLEMGVQKVGIGMVTQVTSMQFLQNVKSVQERAALHLIVTIKLIMVALLQGL